MKNEKYKPGSFVSFCCKTFTPSGSRFTNVTTNINSITIWEEEFSDGSVKHYVHFADKDAVITPETYDNINLMMERMNDVWDLPCDVILD